MPENNIWTLAGDGDLASIMNIVKHEPNIINSQDENGYSMLHAAVSWNHKELVKFLLNSPGININIQDVDGDTPLHFVEKIEIAQLLLDANANPLLSNNEGKIPLITAHEDQRHDLVQFLMRFSPNVVLPEAIDEEGELEHCVVDYNDLMDLVESHKNGEDIEMME